MTVALTGPVRSRWICASCRLSQASRLQGPRRTIHESTIAKREEAARLWKSKADAQRSGAEPTMMKILEERGFVNQIAGDRDKAEVLMRDERLGVYVGIDPTAPSMHVGHLVPFMALFWMYAHGYHTYTLLGGATAAVGDPTGRKTSRDLNGLSRKHNIATMHLQLKTIWANVHRHLTERRGFVLDVGSRRGLVNNSHWLNKLPVTQFLRMLGRNTRIGTMLGRETARYKMEHGDGLSFAEFTYPLLQGWDWWQLYKMLNVKMQIGGSDQMGNITAGKEAMVTIAEEDQFDSGLTDIKAATPIGFTVPLLTTASGAKFGKSEGNAIWLDPEMTSVFDQYQFFVRTADADLERYLKLFTFLSLEEIDAIMQENRRDPSKRVAGKRLAEEVCLTLHGSVLTEKAKEEHAALFGAISTAAAVQDPNHVDWDQKGLTGRPVRINPQVNRFAAQTNAESGFKHQITLPEHRIKSSSFPALMLWTSMVGSRSEGNRMIKAGGAYVAYRANGPMQDSLSYVKIPPGLEKTKTQDYVLDGNMIILRIGKWKTRIVQVVSDELWWQEIAKAKSAKNNHVVKYNSAALEFESEEEEHDDSKINETESTRRGIEWLALQGRMDVDDALWQRQMGEKRARESEEKALKKLIRQETMLDEHARALNPQRKDGRRARSPTEHANVKLVHDWNDNVDKM